jgi:hypothetical protein
MVQEVGFAKLQALGIKLIAADSPHSIWRISLDVGVSSRNDWRPSPRCCEGDVAVAGQRT